MKYLHELHGWHWLVQQVAEWGNYNLDEVYNMPLCSMLTISANMSAKAEYNNLKK